MNNKISENINRIKYTAEKTKNLINIPTGSVYKAELNIDISNILNESFSPDKIGFNILYDEFNCNSSVRTWIFQLSKYESFEMKEIFINENTYYSLMFQSKDDTKSKYIPIFKERYIVTVGDADELFKSVGIKI